MPGTAAKLRAVLGQSCDVYRQTQAGRVKLSTPATVNHSPGPTNEFVSLCGKELKAMALGLVAQLRSFLTAKSATERQQSDEE
jgi:hypothetical protein